MTQGIHGDAAIATRRTDHALEMAVCAAGTSFA
jgi:hypothetical protein